MKTEKINSICRFFGICLVLLYTLLIIPRINLSSDSDAYFLLNRMNNIIDCFKDGIYPFLYYNDFEKVGYGSSIFYGQLTLFPFIPIALQGGKQFILAYFMTSCFLNYFGACSLAKRFTKCYDVIGFLYLSSPLIFMLFICSELYSCYMGVGLGLFFLSSCIDIFRDSKHFYKAVLFFILMFNTHLITTLVCFVICVFICIYYFDKIKIKSYFKFFCLSVFISLYNIFNYLVHIDSLRGESSSFNFNDDNHDIFVLNNFPFLDLIFCKSIKNSIFIGMLVFICWLFIFFKYKLSKKERFIHVISLFAVIIGTNFCWSFLCSYIWIPIQFPVRYLPFVLVIILILTFRRVSNKMIRYIVVLFSLISVLCTSLTLVKPSDCSNSTFTSFSYIGNGEYLSKNFIFDYDTFKKYSTTVIGDDGNTYNYKLDKNRLVVDLYNNISKTITVPKLYYNGYVAEDYSGNRLKCTEGYSMFTEIDVDSFNGELQVYYKQPIYLVILLIFDYLLGIVLVILTVKHIKE